MVASGLIGVIAFTVYYSIAVETYPYVSNFVVNHILRDGLFICISLVFLGVGITEQDRKLRFLVFYPVSFFFAWVLFAYWLNDICDVTIQMSKVVFSTSLTVITCFLLYFFRR